MANLQAQQHTSERLSNYGAYQAKRAEYEAWAKAHPTEGASHAEVMALYDRNCNPELDAYLASSEEHKDAQLTPEVVMALVAGCNTMMAGLAPAEQQ